MQTEIAVEPSVRRTVRVSAKVDHAFRVFTSEFDSWWPKSHHIGSSPMTRGVIEGRVGGRCYSEQEDGQECAWGQILEWEPPHRFVMAWQITPAWKFEPNLEKSSEVEVTFTPADDGTTLVELEHRYFSRHGEHFRAMREGVAAEGGWGTLLGLFKGKAEA